MNLAQLLAQLDPKFFFTYVHDARRGCVNEPLAESAEVALRWAREEGRPMTIRRGDGVVLAVAQPDGRFTQVRTSVR